MTIRLELTSQTEARLIAEARAKGLPLEKWPNNFLKKPSQDALCLAAR
jgi:hypothetical protein